MKDTKGPYDRDAQVGRRRCRVCVANGDATEHPLAGMTKTIDQRGKVAYLCVRHSGQTSLENAW